MSEHSITITVNGEQDRLSVAANMTLLDLLRQKLVLTGTRTASFGKSGPRSIRRAGQRSFGAVEADGAEVVIVEGFHDGHHAIQQEFMDQASTRLCTGHADLGRCC